MEDNLYPALDRITKDCSASDAEQLGTKSNEWNVCPKILSKNYTNEKLAYKRFYKHKTQIFQLQ